MAPRLQRRNIYRRRAQGIRPFWRALAGIVVVALIGLLIYLAETSGKGIPFKSYRTVNISVPNIGHLQQHDPVEIAGVFVGQVESIGTAHNRPLAKLQLSGVGPLPVNSTAVVRGFGLLGARYMELVPGTSSKTLPNDATITETSETQSYTWGIPDFLNLFDPKTRTALGDMWNGFGQGLEGRGYQLNSAIGIGPGSGHDFDTAAYAILDRPGAAQAFLPDLASGFGALDDAGDNLVAMFDPGATTLQAFVTERQPTEATIAEFPTTESGIDAGLSNSVGVPFWNSVGALATTLKPVLPQVPHALDAAVHFLRSTQQPLRNTIPALNEVPAAIPPTLHILSALHPDLTPVRKAFTTLVAPITNLSEHGCDIQNFATATRALVNFGTVPGGNWGPDVGFPLSVQVSVPGYLNSYVGTGKTPFSSISGYYAPCAYSPGPVINSTEASGILQNLLDGTNQ